MTSRKTVTNHVHEYLSAGFERVRPQSNEGASRRAATRPHRNCTRIGEARISAGTSRPRGRASGVCPHATRSERRRRTTGTTVARFDEDDRVALAHDQIDLAVAAEKLRASGARPARCRCASAKASKRAPAPRALPRSRALIACDARSATHCVCCICSAPLTGRATPLLNCAHAEDAGCGHRCLRRAAGAPARYVSGCCSSQSMYGTSEYASRPIANRRPPAPRALSRSSRSSVRRQARHRIEQPRRIAEFDAVEIAIQPGL